VATLRWLRHLLERLGKDCTLSLWQDAYRDYDDELLLEILRTGWKEVNKDDVVDVEESTYEVLHFRFDGLALLTEALIRSLGKQGELIA
jgi:hypothetical protein